MLLLALVGTQATAQEVRYISDQLFVTLRSGQGTEYRIIRHGLPSGTRLVIGEQNEETGYTFVTTPDGTEGWVHSRYLTTEPPARLRLEDALERENQLMKNGQELRQQYVELTTSHNQLGEQLKTVRAQLEEANSELVRIREISGDIVALDADHRQLTETAKTLRTQVEVLRTDNLRLQENRDRETFIRGALAVLVGVVIVVLIYNVGNNIRRRKTGGWA